MNLEQLQRAVFDVVRQPLTEDERMREQTLDGRSTKAIAEEIVKPNDRLNSVEGLEIYNHDYWFRLLSSLADTPGPQRPDRPDAMGCYRDAPGVLRCCGILVAA
jgi:hypothetical protein